MIAGQQDRLLLSIDILKMSAYRNLFTASFKSSSTFLSPVSTASTTQ
jgi:hypothetical protein